MQVSRVFGWSSRCACRRLGNRPTARASRHSVVVPFWVLELGLVHGPRRCAVKTRNLAQRLQRGAATQRERQQGLRQMEFGLRLLSGQRPIDAVNSIGTARPIAPNPPSPINQTIITPSGRMINCTTTGSLTNCY